MDIDDGDFLEILLDTHYDFEAVTDTKIEDQSRWSIYKSCIYQQKSTGKFFEAYWGEGATECQEGQNEPWSFTEVVPREIMTVIYENSPNGLSFVGNMD